MSTATSIAVFLLALLAVANGYSKYGRTCADIGCLSTEECKIMEDPCDGYGRDSCGRYPTCQKKTNVGGGRGETCASKFCSAGTSCRMEDGVPTCKSTVPGLVEEMFAEDKGGAEKDVARRQSTADDTQKTTTGGDPAPAAGGVYPELPKANPNPAAGGGYPAGSGYPSGGGGYPGYPPPNQGYPAPQAGYPAYPNPPQNGGYPGQNPPYNPYPGPPQGGYPNPQGYPPQGGYPPPPQQGYPPQGGYNPYGQQPPTSTTKKPGFFDRLAAEAKKVAADLLKKTVLDEVNKSLNKAV